MRRIAPVLAVVVACSSASSEPATTVLEAGPIRTEIDTRAGSHADLAERIDPSGATLAEAGLDAYRFVSTVDYADDPRLASRYDGAVSTMPRATRIVADGIAGSFVYLASDQGTWYRLRGAWHTPSPNGFQWSPAGPIPSHFVASIIGRLALGSGEIVDLGTETVAGFEVSRLRRIADTIEVDVLITDDALVLGVELTEYLATTSRTVSFVIAGPIDDFHIDPPV